MKKDWNDTELEIALSMFVQNLLRIMAGAGRVQDIRRQLDRLVAATKALESGDALDRGWNHIDHLIENELELGSTWPNYDEQGEIYNIVKNSLRLAAARLAGDNSQASKSNSELFYSIRNYNKAEGTS
jgi:hypothetical protein